MSDWKSAKTYVLGTTTILVLKAERYDPVKFYTEVHENGVYRNSFGSNMPSYWLALAHSYLKYLRQK